MATQVCNNNDVVGQKSKGFTFQSLFRGIKTACRRNKAEKGIKIKKAPTPPQTINDKTRKLSIDDYEALSMIGEGGSGNVYKVREKKTGAIMAMKEVSGGFSPATLMEADILESLSRHPSIVGFKGAARTEHGGVIVVMEYVEYDLKSYIALKKEEGFAIDEVRKLMKQLLEGVKFMHENDVMHRDLRPENILVSKDGDLKICDFGESIRFGKGKASYSPCVGLLWYRPPEMLLGVTDYSSKIDIWSVGCIMAELLLNKVLFGGGEDAGDQLDEIITILGHPRNAKNICSSISSANLVLTEDGFDLLNGLLNYDPRKRMTAKSALKHVWFHDKD